MIINFLSEEEYELRDITVRDLLNKQFCVFDFEGTGIDVDLDFITQIGAIKIINNTIQEGEYFSTLIRSPKQIPEHIERVTGITNEAIMDAPDFSDGYNHFINFVGDLVLVTQAGYEYDVPLLQKECARAGFPMVSNLIIDTKALFTHIHRDVEDIPSTDFLIQYYNVDCKDLKRHDALGDSILIGRIFIKILEEYVAMGLSDFIVESLRVRRFRRPY